MIENNELTERRRDTASQALVALINTLTDQVKELRKEVHELKRISNYNHAVGDEAISKAINRAISEGFPEGDAELHRRMHEIQIKIAEDRSKMYATLRTEVVKWGLLGLVGWLAVTLWHAFLQGPKV